MSLENLSDEVEKWFVQAESDISDAEYLNEDDRTGSAAFHLHQALEKAFKAYQISESQEHDYSHDLVKLAPAEVKNEHGSLLADLNPVYTGTRYPNVSGSLENLSDYIEESKEVVSWIRKQLKM